MTESYAYLFTKAIVTLAFVLVLLGASLYVFKYFIGKRGGAGLKGLKAPIKVLTTSFLGPKRNLAIVDVAGELLVLGITPESITCLTRLDRPPEVMEELRRLGDVKPRSIFKLFR
jgi:flagellar biogenesis protein FliO